MVNSLALNRLNYQRTGGMEYPREKGVSKNPPFWLKKTGIKKCSLDVLVDGGVDAKDYPKQFI